MAKRKPKADKPKIDKHQRARTVLAGTGYHSTEEARMAHIKKHGVDSAIEFGEAFGEANHFVTQSRLLFEQGRLFPDSKSPYHAAMYETAKLIHDTAEAVPTGNQKAENQARMQFRIMDARVASEGNLRRYMEYLRGLRKDVKKP